MEGLKELDKEPVKDEADLFFGAIAVRFRRLNPHQQALAQAKILQVMYDTEFGGVQPHQPNYQQHTSNNYQQPAPNNQLPSTSTYQNGSLYYHNSNSPNYQNL